MNKRFNLEVDPEKDEYVVTMRFKCNKPRTSPYHDDDVDLGTYSEITGVIESETGRFGFAYTIDMDYKDKPDQYTQNNLYLDMEMDQKEFVKLCDDYSIPLAIE